MKRLSNLAAAGTVCLVVVLATAWSWPLAPVQGQEKSKSGKKSGKGAKSKPLANTKSLDIKADQLQTAFTKDAEDLAAQYFEGGHLDKARAILESALAVNPQSTSIQKKLEQVKDGQMNSNDVDVDVNPARGWEPSGVTVTEGRALRIKAEGTYKFDSGPCSLTAAGFSQAEPNHDMVPNFLCGALIGLIVTDDKVGKPFLIGESLDFAPRESGTLLLRINAPKGNKNSGKLKVSISGNVQTQ